MEEVKRYIAARGLIEAFDQNAGLAQLRDGFLEQHLRDRPVAQADSTRFWDDRRFQQYENWNESAGLGAKLVITREQRQRLRAEYLRSRTREVDVLADDEWWRHDVYWPAWRDPVMVPQARSNATMLRERRSTSSDLIDRLLLPADRQNEVRLGSTPPLDKLLKLNLVGSQHDWQLFKEERQRVRALGFSAMGPAKAFATRLAEGLEQLKTPADIPSLPPSPRWDKHLDSGLSDTRPAKVESQLSVAFATISSSSTPDSSPTGRLAVLEPKPPTQGTGGTMKVIPTHEDLRRHRRRDFENSAAEDVIPSKQSRLASFADLARNPIQLQHDQSDINVVPCRNSSDTALPGTFTAEPDQEANGDSAAHKQPNQDEELGTQWRHQTATKSFWDRRKLEDVRKGRAESLLPKPQAVRRDAMADFLASRGIHIPLPDDNPLPPAPRHEIWLPPPQRTRPPLDTLGFREPDFLNSATFSSPHHYTIISYPSMLEKPAHSKALAALGFRLVERSSIATQPDLIIDATSCVWFVPLPYLPGRAFKAEEVQGVLNREAMPLEAVFTSLTRLKSRFDHVLLVLEEGVWTTIRTNQTSKFAYTRPILLALKQLSEALARHPDIAVKIDVVFSESPAQSSELVARSLWSNSSTTRQSNGTYVSDDPTDEEEFLVRHFKMNEMAACIVLSQCELQTFLEMHPDDRSARFGQTSLMMPRQSKELAPETTKRSRATFSIGLGTI
ncbi:hypothetical protein OIV83_002546 [Microbotryomycetes sp. JL201]|nr:hypothetical protein OIV83_002546 [Microbotryomycetes sp. JL201]